MAVDVSDVDSVFDLLGQEVRVGDRIAGAFRQADLAVLKTGVVVGFAVKDYGRYHRGEQLSIKVRWEHSSFTQPAGGISQIDAELLRFVKI